MASEIVGEKRGGGGSIRLNGNELLLTESYEFLVLSDSREATRQQILLETPGLPVVGLIYTSNGLKCIGKDAKRRDDHPFYWDVVCNFESGKENQRENPENPSPDPTTWIPSFEIGFETKERILYEDKSTIPNPAVNSAGQPYETPLIEQITICSVPFVQFEPITTTVKTLMDRNNTINSAEFQGCAVETLLLQVVGAQAGTFGGYPAWRVSYVMKYDPDTWILKLVDAGSCYLSSGNLVPYMDYTNTVQIYGLLDGSGGKTTTEFFKEYQVNEKLDFNSFIRTLA